MRYNRTSAPRTIAAKFAGKCHCCGAAIAAGETVDYHPALRAIAHVGGLDGNSARCASNIAAGFVDTDRMYEDQCAAMCDR